jgi:hypothetical protein
MLMKRRRNAVSAAELGLARDVKDYELLPGVAERYPDGDWVLVTGDDWMPAEHGAVVLETRSTVATIHTEHPPELMQHEWRYDVVQRWAHAMQEQLPQTVRRYSLSGSHAWTPRRKQSKAIALRGWTPWQSGATSADPDAERARGALRTDGQERLPGF